MGVNAQAFIWVLAIAAMLGLWVLALGNLVDRVILIVCQVRRSSARLLEQLR